MEKFDRVLFIPDVHGRRFWKKACEDFLADGKPGHIVFLGDYLDPYEFEGVTWRQCIANLMEILDFAKENRDTVTLLLGNHDMHYWTKEPTDHCRYSFVYGKKVHDMFHDNEKLFSIAWECECGGRKILATHAGVTLGWIQACRRMSEQLTEEKNENAAKLIPPIADARALNGILQTATMRNDDDFLMPFLMISRDRGGRWWSGSCIWADVTEHLNSFDGPRDKVYQVFGHSLSYPPYNNFDMIEVNERFAMLDGRAAVLMTPGEDYPSFIRIPSDEPLVDRVRSNPQDFTNVVKARPIKNRQKD